jgi:hypothetical protein
MFYAGEILVKRWCNLNQVAPPVIIEEDTSFFGTCAYYRNNVIHISVKRCAHIGTGGPAWSFPGYVIDRTPYGVLAHELGHHVDRAHGAKSGTISAQLRRETGEDAITSYAANTNEWFAEIFRLFVTNPGLLAELRPLMYGALSEIWPHEAETREWKDVLTRERQRTAAANKIRSVR